MLRKSFKEFYEELKSKKFEPLPPNVMSSDDFEEALRDRYKSKETGKEVHK